MTETTYNPATGRHEPVPADAPRSWQRRHLARNDLYGEVDEYTLELRYTFPNSTSSWCSARALDSRGATVASLIFDSTRQSQDACFGRIARHLEVTLEGDETGSNLAFVADRLETTFGVHGLPDDREQAEAVKVALKTLRRAARTLKAAERREREYRAGKRS